MSLLLVHAAACSRNSAEPRPVASPPAAVSQAESIEDGEVAPTKAEFLKIAASVEGSDNGLFSKRVLEDVHRKLADPSLSGSEVVKWRIHEIHHLLRTGETQACFQLLPELQKAADDAGLGALPEITWMYVLVNLRLAEQQNCIEGHCEQSCIMPIQRGGVHRRPEPARRASESILRYLATRPDDWLQAAWLLNVVHMTLGTFPEGVPEQYRIDPQRFVSVADIGHFVDVAPQAGLKVVDLAGGVVIEDLDGDGLLDLFTTTMDIRGEAHLFRNVGDGHFEDVSKMSGVADQLGGLHCTAADYDGDGDIDLFIPRGGWILGHVGRMRKSLLRNNGDMTFTDVTDEAGLLAPSYPTQVGLWGDFDNDGDLDIYCASESPQSIVQGMESYPAQLFRNNGDGTFTDIAEQAGVQNNRFAKGAAAGDFDNDGDLDIYVSNHSGGAMGKGRASGVPTRNHLFRNNGDSTFTDVAEELGVIDPANSFATWFFDYDNDGWLDIFVAGYGAEMRDVAAEFFGESNTGERPRIFHNEQGKGFTDRTKELGLDHTWLPMGSAFGDLDNDGYLDIVLGTGAPTYEALDPTVVLRNDGGRGFQDVSFSSGMAHLQKGHGVSFADVDNDGDQDVFEEMGGAFPGDIFGNVLFKNPGHGNHFLKVQLVGTKSNRQGIGARIEVAIETPEGERSVHRSAGSQPSFGNHPTRQEIGLGNATRIKRLEVFWPTSGERQVFEDVPLDTLLRVTEGQDTFETLELRPFSLPSSTTEPAPAA